MNTRKIHRDVKIGYWAAKHTVDVLRIERMIEPEPLTLDQLREYWDRKYLDGLVAEHHGKTAAYTIIDLETEWLEILKFAVSPIFRRLGVGTALMKDLQQNVAQYTQRNILVTVPETDLRAQLFLRSCGFSGSSRGDVIQFIYFREQRENNVPFRPSGIP